MRHLALLVLLVACKPPAAPKGTVAVDAADPDYARAGLADAVKPEGQGGLTEGVVIRLTEDRTVYRLWNGPEAIDANGRTNRIGQWWTFDPPTGTQADYRVDYEVCDAWNQLTWVATCTLKAGSVVAIGPGQSVSPQTCGSSESYPANKKDPQVFVAKAWTRLGSELDCPDASQDYKADPADLAHPAP